MNTHDTVTSTGLDNSHDVSEESVTTRRDLDNAPNATQAPGEPVLQEQPAPETPSVFSRFFTSSGVTERKKTASDDKSLPNCHHIQVFLGYFFPLIISSPPELRKRNSLSNSPCLLGRARGRGLI